MPSVPFLVGKSSTYSSTGGIPLAYPSVGEYGDLVLLFLCTANETVSPPSGWNRIGTGVGIGTAGTAGAARIEVYYRIAAGGETGTTIPDAGDHLSGFMAVYRGVDTSNPIEIFQTAYADVASTSIAFPQITTTVDNCLILNAIASDVDSSAARISGWTNSSLSDLTEQMDYGTSFGFGSGLGYAQGQLATAGTSGITTASLDVASVQALFTIALRPATDLRLNAKVVSNSLSFSDTGFSTSINYPVDTYDLPISFSGSTLSITRGFSADTQNLVSLFSDVGMGITRKLVCQTKSLGVLFPALGPNIYVPLKSYTTIFIPPKLGVATDIEIVTDAHFNYNFLPPKIGRNVLLDVDTKSYETLSDIRLFLIKILRTSNGLSIPDEHMSDSKKLEADAYVDLFEIHLSDGATTIFLKMNNTVSWNGNVYEGTGVKIDGVGNYSDDQVSRPKLSILNPEGIYSSLVNDGLLDNAKVYRYRVLREHLDGNIPIYRRQRWRVSRITSLSTPYIVMELRDMLDGQMFLTPSRMYIPPEFKSVSLR